MNSGSRTTLAADTLAKVRVAIFRYLRDHESITNRALRELTGIGYDQAIDAFRKLQKSGDLNKEGVASATRYVLSASAKLSSSKPRA